MSDATPGNDSGVRVAASGSPFKSDNETGGTAYGNNGDPLDSCNSFNAPNGRNALDSTDFWDEAEDSKNGLKTGEWSLDGNWPGGASIPAGLQTLKGAHDNDTPVEVALTPDRNNPTVGGYEMTAIVTQFQIQSEPNGKATWSATVRTTDGDGWSPLAA